MRRRGLLLATAAAPASLAACGSLGGTAPETFAARPGPPFAPERFFAGRLVSHGLFADRLGTIRRWFEADLDGTWDGATLTFAEVFRYDDGWVDRRTWRLRRDGPGRWRGTATDIVGEAVGEEHGPAFTLRHTLDMLREGGGTRRLAFDQWFVRVSDEVALSRAEVSWRGLVGVGTAQVGFRRLPA